jgi:hypothetical protein
VASVLCGSQGWSLEEAGPTAVDLIVDVEAAEDITDALRLLLNPEA